MKKFWERRERVIVAVAVLGGSLMWLFGPTAEQRRIMAAKEHAAEQARAHGLDVQHASIERCRKAGGFAVMGFAAVVCVEPGSVKWSEEIPW